MCREKRSSSSAPSSQAQRRRLRPLSQSQTSSLRGSPRALLEDLLFHGSLSLPPPHPATMHAPCPHATPPQRKPGLFPLAVRGGGGGDEWWPPAPFPLPSRPAKIQRTPLAHKTINVPTPPPTHSPPPPPPRTPQSVRSISAQTHTHARGGLSQPAPPTLLYCRVKAPSLSRCLCLLGCSALPNQVIP